MFTILAITSKIFSATEPTRIDQTETDHRLTYIGRLLTLPVVEKICVKTSQNKIYSFECKLLMQYDSSYKPKDNIYRFELEEVLKKGFHLVFTAYDTTTTKNDYENENYHQADVNYANTNFLSIFIEKGIEIITKNSSVILSISLTSFSFDQMNNLSEYLWNMTSENKKLYLSIPMFFANVIDYWYWDGMAFDISTVSNNEEDVIKEYKYSLVDGAAVQVNNRNYSTACLQLIKFGMKNNTIVTQSILSFVNTPVGKELSIEVDSGSDDILSVEIIPFWETVAGVSMLVNLSILFVVFYIPFIYKFYIFCFGKGEVKD